MITNCICVGKHVPLPTNEIVINVGDELITLCPTSWNNVERLLSLYTEYKGRPPGSIIKHFSTYIQAIAGNIWYNKEKEMEAQ